MVVCLLLLVEDTKSAESVFDGPASVFLKKKSVLQNRCLVVKANDLLPPKKRRKKGK